MVAAALAAPSTAGARAKPEFYGATAIGPTSPALLQRASMGGMRTLRLQFNWGEVEPVAGARNWEGLDERIAAAATAGVEVVPLLLGVPTWVSANASTPPLFGAEVRAAWTTFVADAARRYGPGGAFWTLNPQLTQVPVRNWQVWNEVNLPFFWGGRSPNPRLYARLLRISRSALLSGDPGAKVIGAGILPFRAVAGGSVGGAAYLRRLLKLKGVVKLLDAVAIHPYAREPGLIHKALFAMRLHLNQLGGGRLELWATEFGWNTAGRSPFATTPSGQARRVSAAYRLLAKNRTRLKLRRALYFSLSDFDLPDVVEDWTAHTGLFDLTGQPKPAWHAFARTAGGVP